jgi:hypothetical protein
MDFNENLNPEEEQQAQQPEDAVFEEPIDAQEVVLEETPIVEEEPQQLPKVRQRVSPYADSPYVMNHVVEEPVKTKKVKKAKQKKGGFWKEALCAVLVLALIGGASVATGAAVNEYWEERFDAMEDSFED